VHRITGELADLAEATARDAEQLLVVVPREVGDTPGSWLRE
jgi:hypothetical protein